MTAEKTRINRIFQKRKIMGNKSIKKIKTEGFPNTSNSHINELNENLKKISLSQNDIFFNNFIPFFFFT